MEVVACRTFRNERVILDEKHFVDCDLIECILEYSGGPIAFESSKISRCQYFFYGPARRTVDYLQAVGLVNSNPSEWAEESEQVH